MFSNASSDGVQTIIGKKKFSREFLNDNNNFNPNSKDITPSLTGRVEVGLRGGSPLHPYYTLYTLLNRVQSLCTSAF